MWDQNRAEETASHSWSWINMWVCVSLGRVLPSVHSNMSLCSTSGLEKNKYKTRLADHIQSLPQTHSNALVMQPFGQMVCRKYIREAFFPSVIVTSLLKREDIKQEDAALVVWECFTNNHAANSHRQSTSPTNIVLTGHIAWWQKSVHLSFLSRDVFL